MDINNTVTLGFCKAIIGIAYAVSMIMNILFCCGRMAAIGSVQKLKYDGHIVWKCDMQCLQTCLYSFKSDLLTNQFTCPIVVSAVSRPISPCSLLELIENVMHSPMHFYRNPNTRHKHNSHLNRKQVQEPQYAYLTAFKTRRTFQ
jgi:hypothetical protein